MLTDDALYAALQAGLYDGLVRLGIKFKYKSNADDSSSKEEEVDESRDQVSVFVHYTFALVKQVN
jgi:hypothetical protein